MQILWVNILMDGPPAQSLGVEPVDRDVVLRPPRRRDESIISTALLVRVATAAAVISTGTMLVFYREMSHDFLATRRDTTMTFTAFVLFDMFNALSCRSEDKSVLSLGLASNRFFMLAVGGSLLGQLAVVYVPWFQAIFQTEALAFGDWVLLTLLASTVLWVDEAIKAWQYGTLRTSPVAAAVRCLFCCGRDATRRRFRMGYGGGSKGSRGGAGGAGAGAGDGEDDDGGKGSHAVEVAASGSTKLLRERDGGSGGGAASQRVPVV